MRGAKLTELKVREIIAELSTQNPRPSLEIAAQYGVSDRMIRYIRQGKTWRHIERPQVLNCAKPQSKLTDADVIEIKKLKGTGISGWAVSLRYGVTQTTISQIWRGVSWRHVEVPQ